MEKPMAGYAREVVWAIELHNSGGHDERNVRAGEGRNPETQGLSQNRMWGYVASGSGRRVPVN